jgi:hypothetical protein
MTMHPNYKAVTGQQPVQFRFPDGTVMAFGMVRKGIALQTNIGFGAEARRFYKAIEANPSLRIELPGVNDAVDVSLAERRRVEGGLRYCRKWLK